MRKPVTVHLLWDFSLESPTLGGALVLRQEGELLAQLKHATRVVVHLVGGSETHRILPLAAKLFAASALDFEISNAAAPVSAWPLEQERAGLSYFSFSRILRLHSDHGYKPRLAWRSYVLDRVRAIRFRYPGRLVCLHLRSVSPFKIEESNTDGAIWNDFLLEKAEPGRLEFLLLGDDLLPAGLRLRPGVYRAIDHGIGLAEQLALIGEADGFIGMASGICTAANFSAVPHVVLKHPSHHLEQMQRELGSSDRFPFFTEKQRLWRMIPTRSLLDKALDFILS